MMSDVSLDETYLPPAQATGASDLDHEFQQMCLDIARLSLQPQEGHPSLLVGGERIDLPEPMVQILVQVAKAMSQGLAISVVPHATMVSTQEAADILAISRPTLVRLLEAGKIPYQQKNRHRRLYLTDVIEYQKRQRRMSTEMLDYDADLSEVDNAIRQVRKGRSE